MGSCWRATALCSSRSADCIEYCDVARTPTESRVRARSAFSAKPQDADLAVTRERLRGTLPYFTSFSQHQWSTRIRRAQLPPVACSLCSRHYNTVLDGNMRPSNMKGAISAPLSSRAVVVRSVSGLTSLSGAVYTVHA
jgi:hypothetical protein